MKITIENIEKHFAKLKDFPKYYKEYLDDVPCTMDLEEQGKNLLQDFDADVLKDFIERVVKWGGIARNVKGTTYKEYEKKKKVIVDVFRSVLVFLRKGNIRCAIEKITELKGIGISSGSKFLRMMSPEQAGVYDSILRERFCYKNYDGYIEFCTALKKIVEKLEKEKIKHPFRAKGKWLVADVEAVIFHLQRKRKNQ